MEASSLPLIVKPTIQVDFGDREDENRLWVKWKMDLIKGRYVDAIEKVKLDDDLEVWRNGVDYFVSSSGRQKAFFWDNAKMKNCRKDILSLNMWRHNGWLKRALENGKHFTSLIWIERKQERKTAGEKDGLKET